MVYKEPRVELFKKLNKNDLSQITFFLEDDDHKSSSFIGETTPFACQLIKIKQMRVQNTLDHF